jgi:hypothetical protein
MDNSFPEERIVKPEEKANKNNQNDRAGVSREFIQKVSEELQAIRKNKAENR